MNFSRLPRHTVRAALVASIACLTIAPAFVVAGPNDGTTPGMNGPASGANGEQSTFEYFFDRKSVFVEDKDVKLPALPDYNALLPFEVSKASNLTFAVDPKSVAVGKDGAVRYTVVITSPAGARNVRYEGIRCGDGQMWKTYAAIDEDGTAWEPDSSTDWEQIEYNTLNAYHNTLARDFFCDFSTVAGDTRTIVENIKYKRTLTDQRVR